MKIKRLIISVLILFWIGLFHYESLRHNYLSKWAGHELTKFPLLFPPAGWIMFFQVGPSFGTAEVYRIAGGRASPLDRREIFKTRNVGYDNLHRNIMSGVLNERQAASFCSYLQRTFPESEGFVVAYAGYPDLIGAPEQAVRRPMYRCGPSDE